MLQVLYHDTHAPLEVDTAYSRKGSVFYNLPNVYLNCNFTYLQQVIQRLRSVT